MRRRVTDLLADSGQSTAFYPDFLAWKGKNIFALDTKGEHILESELGRKLLAIDPNPKAKTKLPERLRLRPSSSLLTWSFPLVYAILSMLTQGPAVT